MKNYLKRALTQGTAALLLNLAPTNDICKQSISSFLLFRFWNEFQWVSFKATSNNPNIKNNTDSMDVKR